MATLSLTLREQPQLSLVLSAGPRRTMIFLPGDVVESRCHFTKTDTGELVDPTTIRFYLTRPGESTPTTYTFPHAILTKEADGRYLASVPITGASVAGKWKLRWEGAGTLAGAAEGFFRVDPSQVLPPS